MTGDIGVLAVHGVGTQDERFADAFWEKLVGEIRARGFDPSRVRWRPAFWADVLAAKQRDLWRRLRLDRLRWDPLRRFVVDVLGDATAYRVTGRGHRDVYKAIQEVIRRNLADLRKQLGELDKPLVVVAHSLGSHIISNYTWDAQHERRRLYADFDEWSAFERMETLTGIVTVGSPIPLFTLAYEDVKAITFPPLSLPEHLRGAARWLNLFDADDVLGYPLRGLSDSYAQAVGEDREINVGGPVNSWNPTSHGKYWGDGNFVRPVAGLITRILAAV